MLLWTFGVLYVALVFYLPSLSLFVFLCFVSACLEFPVVDIVGVGGVCDCQNDSIVGWLDGSRVPLHCCWSSSDWGCSICSISFIAAAFSDHSSETASASVLGTSFKDASLLLTSLLDRLSSYCCFEILI